MNSVAMLPYSAGHCAAALLDQGRGRAVTPPSVLPPAPRKRPQQSRSRILVASLVEACTIVLREKGPGGISAREIADVAGVTMGSMYQYFPNVDAIIAMLYEECIEKHTAELRAKLSQRWCAMSLESALEELIGDALSLHRQLLRLDREFQRSFYENSDLQSWFDRIAGEPQASFGLLRDVLASHSTELGRGDVDMLAFVLGTSLRSAIREALKHNPKYLDSSEFLDSLLGLSLGVLGVTTSAH